jgi:hypothetical protein
LSVTSLRPAVDVLAGSTDPSDQSVPFSTCVSPGCPRTTDAGPEREGLCEARADEGGEPSDGDGAPEGDGVADGGGATAAGGEGGATAAGGEGDDGCESASAHRATPPARRTVTTASAESAIRVPRDAPDRFAAIRFSITVRSG